MRSFLRRTFQVLFWKWNTVILMMTSAVDWRQETMFHVQSEASWLGILKVLSGIKILFGSQFHGWVISCTVNERTEKTHVNKFPSQPSACKRLNNPCIHIHDLYITTIDVNTFTCMWCHSKTYNHWKYLPNQVSGCVPSLLLVDTSTEN